MRLRWTRKKPGLRRRGRHQLFLIRIATRQGLGRKKVFGSCLRSRRWEMRCLTRNSAFLSRLDVSSPPREPFKDDGHSGFPRLEIYSDSCYQILGGVEPTAYVATSGSNQPQSIRDASRRLRRSKALPVRQSSRFLSPSIDGEFPLNACRHVGPRKAEQRDSAPSLSPSFACPSS